jgi:hypothetical protein
MAASGHLTGHRQCGLSFSGIDEILVSNLTETEKHWKVNLIRQNHFTKQIFKPLKMVLCSSCDGVPLKFKKEKRLTSSSPAQII